MVLLRGLGSCSALHEYVTCTALISPLVVPCIDVSLGIISLCHVHKEFDGERIGKRYRLSVRLSVAIILIFLPLADSLSSLKLISITTGMVFLTLMVDVYGSTSIHDDFWKCTTQCKYRAMCPIKRNLAMEAAKTGTTIKLEEVRIDDNSEKAYYDVWFPPHKKKHQPQILPSIRLPVCSTCSSSTKFATCMESHLCR